MEHSFLVNYSIDGVESRVPILRIHKMSLSPLDLKILSLSDDIVSTIDRMLQDPLAIKNRILFMESIRVLFDAVPLHTGSMHILAAQILKDCENIDYYQRSPETTWRAIRQRTETISNLCKKKLRPTDEVAVVDTVQEYHHLIEGECAAILGWMERLLAKEPVDRSDPTHFILIKMDDLQNLLTRIQSLRPSMKGFVNKNDSMTLALQKVDALLEKRHSSAGSVLLKLSREANISFVKAEKPIVNLFLDMTNSLFVGDNRGAGLKPEYVERSNAWSDLQHALNTNMLPGIILARIAKLLKRDDLLSENRVPSIVPEASPTAFAALLSQPEEFSSLPNSVENENLEALMAVLQTDDFELIQEVMGQRHLSLELRQHLLEQAEMLKLSNLKRYLDTTPSGASFPKRLRSETFESKEQRTDPGWMGDAPISIKNFDPDEVMNRANTEMQRCISTQITPSAIPYRDLAKALQNHLDNAEQILEHPIFQNQSRMIADELFSLIVKSLTRTIMEKFIDNNLIGFCQYTTIRYALQKEPFTTQFQDLKLKIEAQLVDPKTSDSNEELTADYHDGGVGNANSELAESLTGSPTTETTVPSVAPNTR